MVPMKIFPHIIIAILCLGFANVCFAQKGKATIYKNKNVQASGLYHDFNKSKDTLVLRSNKKINYLYTANNSNKKDINLRVDSNSYKLPLNELKKGRNVLVAVQSPLKIVFVVEVEREFPKPLEKTLSIVD
ncbi:hypothetical protein GCM10011444_13500 [Winogradskyella haliclonae]|uniref:DUF2846 domain-containing protein n=2 Tax=Winogradskyella haliclonae TaxID=2048558 RepID=A0ABQ2BX23_9FLAO|nr:hypothetical protein GCM10011444_13500 [Winogradskyella haliclonae]